jgi:hypothetical protein
MAMTRPPSRLPQTCAVAFKEWAGICDALAAGRQCVILRKGGIAEGPGGFSPERDAFWLYPTRVHEAEQGLRAGQGAPTPPPPAPAGWIDLRALAVVAEVGFIDRAERLPELAEFHAWTEDTIRKRFEYRQPGLWVLGVRVFVRPEPWRIAEAPAHAGCKSWVPLDAPWSTSGLAPALDDEVFARQMDHLRTVLLPPPG